MDRANCQSKNLISHLHFGIRELGVLAVFLTSVIATSCSFLPESSIPGNPTDPITLKPIPVSTVLTALKCQIEQGLDRIQARREKLAESDDPRGEIFKLQKGSVTFSGKTTIVGTDDGDVSIVIPVGISTLTPSVGGELTSTATEEITRTFSVETDVEVSICKILGQTNSDIQIGTFIADRMEAAFNDSLAVPMRIEPVTDEETKKLKKATKPYGPLLKNTSITIKATFSVQRTLQAGVKSDILFSSSDSSSPTLSPGIVFGHDAKGEYEISVKFPMTAADPGDDQRFYKCVRNLNVSYCVERPYDEQLHGALVAATGDTRRLYQCIERNGRTYCLESPFIEDLYQRLFTAPPGEAFEPQGVLPLVPDGSGAILPSPPPPVEFELQTGPTGF